MHNAVQLGCRALLYEDRRLSIRQLEFLMTGEMGDPIARTTIAGIVKNDLNFRKMCVRWVPCRLTETHKKNRMAAALNFLEQYSNEGETC